ncbi:MarR family EPS-associated transcriptional regulator [Limnohabitans sp. 2KL-17]|uniref:MarR family EPS-associated transcriptional regulator n=1 Tax=Limnohabitans sp. 2KL-17 TaxID=1100704 RepID=UPI001E326A00|nr:MarR family EPS-associated transcriptional regulator [Limnohabitans sp. 2KL-17]
MGSLQRHPQQWHAANDSLDAFCLLAQGAHGFPDKAAIQSILQSIICFVHTSNKCLKYGTVLVQLKITDLFAVVDPLIALPIAPRHCGSVPKALLSPHDCRLNATPMTSPQAKIQEDTHFRIMRILQENPDLTQRELADQLGMSVSGLNYCLKALIDKGFVKMQNFQNSKNKFKYVYLLTPMGIAEKLALTSRFLSRKMQEYEALKLEIQALQSEVDTPGQDKTQKA